ncbi:adenylate/guanylate cyclase domain-containing protein [Agrobacterium vitis]|uniref:Adenylate cyclase protein n=2 Tax=Rhizobium/Agrobacterium group TaxID=227290 RepID=B9K611_ALLAM|nr:MULTISPECIES: adenylate/guanylate cyclase domain-containing protein [Rhizobium/Agrobacterium group]ACM40309.1 adenylate cyclase protein [Allorhizobium ampelinum S4]MUO31775.1 adenylate/guanylate cyclase domain-containing protein [Agrobacterium vitis]NSY51477.1 adenylate/guanylate cyclase domain-containing protein [Agrobacterium tumefaciens]NTF22703.1 adenylate/guanylate cyclase domain-containing protein [Agrobacterium rubi]MDX8332095.1 adenylate/guanylate cyclase domain-containing protein [
MDKKSSPLGNSAATREIRSASLRFVVLSILFANLVFGDGLASFTTHVIVNSVYLIVSVASVAAAVYFPRQKHLGQLFVMLDAALVVVILYEHILANPITQDHNLTTSSLVVSFILLNHVGLKLDRWLIVVFSTIVVSAWVLMLAIMAFRHHDSSPGTLLANFFNQDLGLTVSFAFTAMAVYLLARDHDRTVRQALRIEEKRMNLSRFFSPTVVADLQTASASLDLERRDAAIMFVDIRDFTSYAETASSRELACVLGEYRHIVAGAVFAYGGTVDKFIGDGVMAVFGQPKPKADDARRALACALTLTEALEEWGGKKIEKGGPRLYAGIGLHYGTVLGGVLESGFHDEFTVIGDAVNVAQRLESLASLLKSPLVVSDRIIEEVPGMFGPNDWVYTNGVSIPGRKASVNIAYIRRTANLASPAGYETGDIHTDFKRSSFQSRPRIPLVGM